MLVSPNFPLSRPWRHSQDACRIKERAKTIVNAIFYVISRYGAAGCSSPLAGVDFDVNRNYVTLP
jgi:hypothetical protein